MVLAFFEPMSEFIAKLIEMISGILPQEDPDMILSIDQAVDRIQDSNLLAYINWFVPFYLFAPMFVSYITACLAAITIFIVFKFILNKFK